MEIEHKGVTYSLLGLSSTAAEHLLKLGAKQFLRARKNPRKAWADLSSGYLFEPRPKPLIVQAIAATFSLSQEDAAAQWALLSKAEKAELRKRPNVRKALLTLELRALEDTAQTPDPSGYPHLPQGDQPQSVSSLKTGSE